MAKIETAIQACRTTPAGSPQRVRVESALCRATREAYSDFHSLSLVSGRLDRRATEALDGLLRTAIGEFQAINLAGAVTQRYQDFQDFCALMEGSGDFVGTVLDRVSRPTTPRRVKRSR